MSKHFWDEWRGSADGTPTFWLKRLLYVPLWKRNEKWLGCRIDLHKFVGADDVGCFHTHPAWAIRFVFSGGYVEEVWHTKDSSWSDSLSHQRLIRPLHIGLIKPAFAHRIHKLLNGKSSYSLWLRGPVIAPINLVGWGWPKNAIADPRAGVK